MLLYPRLPRGVAQQLVMERSSESIEKLVQISSLTHPAATYAPTGGHRITATHLADIQLRIRDCAAECGYPKPLDDAAGRLFDAESAKILHHFMELSPSEASRESMWAFIACIVLPNVVRWRFPGTRGITTDERFLGGSRGLRNTFGRVWWRAQILYQPRQSEPYQYLKLLGEDELVQITERPNLAGHTTLARQICRSFLQTARNFPSVSRSDVLRDAMKRMRRLLPLLSFDTLDPAALEEMVDDVFMRSAKSLAAGRERTR